MVFYYLGGLGAVGGSIHQNKASFQGDENLLKPTVVTVGEFCNQPKNHQGVHFNWVSCMLWKQQLCKTVTLKIKRSNSTGSYLDNKGQKPKDNLSNCKPLGEPYHYCETSHPGYQEGSLSKRKPQNQINADHLRRYFRTTLPGLP